MDKDRRPAAGPDQGRFGKTLGQAIYQGRAEEAGCSFLPISYDLPRSSTLCNPSCLSVPTGQTVSVLEHHVDKYSDLLSEVGTLGFLKVCVHLGTCLGSVRYRVLLLLVIQVMNASVLSLREVWGRYVHRGWGQRNKRTDYTFNHSGSAKVSILAADSQEFFVTFARHLACSVVRST